MGKLWEVACDWLSCSKTALVTVMWDDNMAGLVFL